MRKKVLIVSPVPTHPPLAGKRVGIRRMAETFASLGHEVHLLFTNHEEGDAEAMRSAWGEDRFHQAPYHWPRRTALHLLNRLRWIMKEGSGDLRPVDAYYDSSLDDVLRRLHARHRFDVVVAEYVFWSRSLEAFPAGVLKVVDTHDVFSNRHRLYRERGLDYGWYSTTPDEEARGLARADVVIAVSDEEAAYFRRLVPRRVITVGRMVPVAPPPQSAGVPGRILFVASDTTINADGLVHFLDRVLPRVLEAIPGAELHVAGGVGRHAAGRKGCVVLGRVEDLAPLYAAARVVVNPIRFSTGLSIKSVEALGHARALVTTTAGSAGLVGKLGTAARVVDADGEFAAEIIRLLGDDAAVLGLQTAAHRFALEWNRSCLAALQEILESPSPP